MHTHYYHHFRDSHSAKPDPWAMPYQWIDGVGAQINFLLFGAHSKAMRANIASDSAMCVHSVGNATWNIIDNIQWHLLEFIPIWNSLIRKCELWNWVCVCVHDCMYNCARFVWCTSTCLSSQRLTNLSPVYADRLEKAFSFWWFLVE